MHCHCYTYTTTKSTKAAHAVCYSPLHSWVGLLSDRNPQPPSPPPPHASNKQAAFVAACVMATFCHNWQCLRIIIVIHKHYHTKSWPGGMHVTQPSLFTPILTDLSWLLARLGYLQRIITNSHRARVISCSLEVVRSLELRVAHNGCILANLFCTPVITLQKYGVLLLILYP